MNDIEINIFGLPAIRVAGGAMSPLSLPPASSALFGILALHGSTRPMRREYLTDALWPDCPGEQQRARLRTAIWRLRKGLPEWGRTMIGKTASTIQLRLPGGSQMVHTAFETAVLALCARPTSEMTEEEFSELDGWLRRYNGPLLEGLDGEWLSADRTRLSDIYCQGLQHQIQYLREHGRDHETIRAGQRLLDEDPYQEVVHQVLATSYARLGQTQRAKSQMRLAKKIFQTDLGFECFTDEICSFQRDDCRNNRSNSQADIVHLVAGLQETMLKMAEQLNGIQASLARQSQPESEPLHSGPIGVTHVDKAGADRDGRSFG